MLLITSTASAQTQSSTINADGTATLSVDSDIAEGTAGHYYVNMPATGTSTLTLTEQDIAEGKGTFKVYDDGGKNGDFSKLKGNNVTLIINAPQGYVLRFSGSIVTSSAYDYISVYAGSGNEGMVLANQVYGTSSTPINDAICLKQSLTVCFQSGWGNTSAAGFDLTVECIDNNGKTYDAPDWLAIDPSKDAQAEGYYYVNMPISGSAAYEIPDGFEKSFQVRYSPVNYDEKTGTITLTAPSGRKMTYTGEWSNGSSNKTECSFTIKEGSTTKMSGYNNTTILETTTNYNSLTIECYSKYSLGALTLNIKMKADPIRISNLSEFYAYTGSNITVSPTVSDADASTTLTAGTDYDVTFSPAEVKDKGVYTATVSGKGSYSFTKTFNFLVGTLEYIDENGTTQSKAHDELTLLTARNELPATLTGWYLVADNITFSNVVEVSGTAHLILADGTTMNANRIRVNSGNTLNIYGQTGGTGKLVVSPKGSVSNDAGIGASYGNSCGTITINGGNINSKGMYNGAGIGAAPNNSCGTITVNGGVVSSEGANDAADIGGMSGGSVVINGGQITANINGIGAATVSLGWKNSETDFIQSAKYSGTVSFQEGKIFVLDGMETGATLDNITGKKIVPASAVYKYNLAYSTIIGIADYYDPNTEGIALSYQVKDLAGVTLTKGTDYTETFTNNSTSATVDKITESGVYTMTITGTGSYSGTKTVTISVAGYKETLGGYDFTVLGDENGLYYKVDNADDLNALAAYVNAGNICQGKTFKQTDNITLTGTFTMIGEGGNAFQGTYDGNNLAINGLVVNTDDSQCGFFREVQGTVKNLRLISPSITSTYGRTGYSTVQTWVGGIASCTNNGGKILNCYVIAPALSAPNETNDEFKRFGVIVGYTNDINDRISDCYYYSNDFAGIINQVYDLGVSNIVHVYQLALGEGIASTAGLISVGSANYYTEGTAVTVAATVPSSGMKKFTTTGASASTTETLGQYTLTMPANDVTVSLADVTLTISDIDNQTYTGSAITPEITVTDDETTLTLNTDYKVSYSNNTNAGTAKAIITGKGNYSGAIEKTFTITPKVTTLGALTLTEYGDRTTAVIDGNSAESLSIDSEEGIAVNSVTYSRNFVNDGGAYTIMLPFSFTVTNAVKGTFHTLSSIAPTTETETVWKATMSDAITTIEANKPYIFVPSEDFDEMTFENVTLQSTVSAPLTNVCANTNWKLHGVYSKKTWTDDDENLYGFAATEKGDISVGEFVHFVTGATLKATRCYLEYSKDGFSKSAAVLPERIILVFPDETASVIEPNDPENTNGDITTPVSEIAPNSGVKVWSYDGTIYIESQPHTDYTIIDLTGRTLLTGVTTSTRETVTLSRRAAGIVIVVINGKTFKVKY